MSALDVLGKLRLLDVHVWVENGNLRCTAPKNVLTAALKDELAANKSEIIAFLTAASGQPSPDAPEIPVTATQARVWLLDQFQPGNPAYNVPIAYRLEGPVDVEKLRRALSEIVARHDSLRCVFESKQGQPWPRVLPPVPVELLVVDLEGTADDELHELLIAESRRPFDVSRDLLFRAKLFRLADTVNVLFFSMHHIAADRWSVSIILRELVEIYNGRPLAAPARFIEYARDEAEWLGSTAAREGFDYWKKRLEGELPVLELPSERQRPARLSSSGACEFLEVPEALKARGAELAGRYGTTPFVVWMSVFQVLLHRYTGLTDILVGCPVANRPRGTENTVGLFINTIVLRTDLSQNPSFAEVIGRVHNANKEAMAHARVPFAKLLEVLPQTHDAAHSPLFQVAFSLQQWMVETSDPCGLTITQYPFDTGVSGFDLSFNLIELGKTVTLACEYNTDIFDRPAMIRLLGHYLMLLESAADHPDQLISAMPMLTEQERDWMLLEWNRTGSDYPRDTCLHQLVEQQAARTPDAPALIFKHEIITYRELNARSNRVAHAMIAGGFRVGSLAAICMERSPDFVVAAIAAHKAGGAYIPLDPAYPADRIGFMLEDSGVPVLLTNQSMMEAASHAGMAVLAIDVAAVCSEYSDANLNLPADPDRLAYVIYTSGSTGKPKGVEIQQRALVNFLVSMQSEPGMSATDTLLAVTTFCFDIAGLELFLPLICGASTVIAPREMALSATELKNAIERYGVTIMQATPTTWRMLIESGWEGNSRLKVLCGGEALPRELMQSLLPRCESLWNMYGPTETTVWSAVHRIDSATAPIVVGRPIANTTTYILDSHLQPVPIGVTGELYIGGDGVAAGYLNRPELTAERFIDDPFRGGQGARIYRTGDLARYRSNGVIELLGRLDHQVKIRGFRIELGELEAALERDEYVRQAAVVAVDTPERGKILVAYIVPREGGDCSTSRLRAELARTLPEYMIPSVFMPVDRMPLTPNGKIDRRGLPKPPTADAPANAAFTWPESKIEATIAAVWKEALKLERVGKKDNFFDLGGHSLLLVKVHERLRKTVDDHILLMDLFQYPTIEALAAIIESKRSSLAAAGA